MRRALVTGVTGFVARALVQRLKEDGWRIRGTTRQTGRTYPGLEDIELIECGSLGPETDWTHALGGVSVVFHLASRVHQRNESGAMGESAYRIENTAGTAALAQAAAKAGVERFVFGSTVKVNGKERQAPYTEADEPVPADVYGASKLDAERALRMIESETGMVAFVLRSPLVYGPGVRANFLSLVELVDRGLPLPLASVTNSRSLIAADNLADAMALCATTEGAGGTFLVSDGDDVSTPELVRRIGIALGRKVRLFAFPPSLLERALRLLGRGGTASRLLGSLRVDSSAIRARLSWRPRTSMAEELACLAEWYRERKVVGRIP